jgi:hypothetical protein
MQPSRWSLADLDRQPLVVRRIAERTGADLRALDAARERLAADVRNALGGPLALLACFVAGFVVGRRPPQRQADRRRRSNRWLPRAAAVLKVLSAPAYSAFFRSLVSSTYTLARPRGDVAWTRWR